MPERPLTPAQQAELAESLRRLLGAVRAGELTAAGGMVNRLEGALVALGAMTVDYTRDSG